MKKFYIGNGSNYVNVKKMYIGIDGTARKIKKVYVGVNNGTSSVARLCYLTAGKVPVFTTPSIAPLTGADKSAASAITVNNKAIFIGGHNSNSFSRTIDFYDSSGVKTTGVNVQANVYGRAVASCSIAGMITGGLEGTSTTAVNRGYYYDSSLTRKNLNLSTARTYHTGVGLPSYLIFAGGKPVASTTSNTRTVEAFTPAGARATSPTSVNLNFSSGAGAAADNLAIFAGGAGNVNGVYSYSSTLAFTRLSNLSVCGVNLCGTSFLNYALFFGGYNNYISYSTVLAYTNAGVQTTLIPASLSVNRGQCAATSVGNYCIVAGGISGTTQASRYRTTTVDIYTNQLVRLDPSVVSLSLTKGTAAMGATTVGNYAYFGGGNTGTSQYGNGVNGTNTVYGFYLQGEKEV